MDHLGIVDIGQRDVEVAQTFGVEVFVQLVELMAMVEVFDGLLEADGDEQADDDGGDVDEEVFPSVGGFVGRVDVEHEVAPVGDMRQ